MNEVGSNFQNRWREIKGFKHEHENGHYDDLNETVLKTTDVNTSDYEDSKNVIEEAVMSDDTDIINYDKLEDIPSDSNVCNSSENDIKTIADESEGGFE